MSYKNVKLYRGFLENAISLSQAPRKPLFTAYPYIFFLCKNTYSYTFLKTKMGLYYLYSLIRKFFMEYRMHTCSYHHLFICNGGLQAVASQVKSGLQPDFVSKVLLEYTHSFTDYLWLLWCYHGWAEWWQQSPKAEVFTIWLFIGNVC